jgi:hypothetical protein
MESSHTVSEIHLDSHLLNDENRNYHYPQYHENIFCLNTKYLFYILFLVMIIMFVVYIIIVSLHI